MNAEELKQLLEKYYSGESTPEEETFLREYFNGDYIPEGFEAEREIFSYYTESASIPEPADGFENRIMDAIDLSERVISGPIKIRRYLIPIMSAAASILIIAGSYFFFVRNNQLKDTYSDPKMAYAETMKILIDVSSKMNHATVALEPIGKMNKMKTKSFEAINKSTGIIEKNLKTLNYLKGPADNAGFENSEEKRE
jgi:hypothetical protein